MDPNSDEKYLKIFTLNCWGLRFVSEHRQQRIKLIAQHLVDHNYDIVFLQEVWCQSDFDYIRSTTKSKYRFAHMFKNASILGTSGLAVLTTWTPNVFHFHSFSVNGSPFRPLHGDWFTSKGVGYVRIELDTLNLHLFCTHMHAQYDLNERIDDQYSVHRICQSYETAKFINLMTNCISRISKTRDLIVLAGDMNASSKELPYRLLVSLTGLYDCYKFKTKSTNKVSDGLESGDCVAKVQQMVPNIMDYDSTDDEDLITCGHRDNAFTPKHINPKENGAKRMDFILFKLLDTMKSKNGEQFKSFEDNCAKSEFLQNKDNMECTTSSFCEVEHISICCKDDSGLSFSDHQPVVAKLKIYNFDSNTAISNSKLVSAEETDIPEAIYLNGDSIAITKDLDVGSGDGFTDNIKKCEQIGLLTGKHKFKSNLLSEVTETASKVAKNGPLQLKQIASNAIKCKFQSKVLDNRPLLETTKRLLENYVTNNQLTLTYFVFVLILSVICVFALILILLMFISMTIIEVLFLVLIITIIICLSVFLKFLTDRHEKNAVKAILNDIKKDILFN